MTTGSLSYFLRDYFAAPVLVSIVVVIKIVRPVFPQAFAGAHEVVKSNEGEPGTKDSDRPEDEEVTVFGGLKGFVN